MQNRPQLQRSIASQFSVSMIWIVFILGALYYTITSMSDAAKAQQSGVTLDVRITQSVDDVEERLSDGAIYTNSSDLEIGDDPETLGDQAVGVRFRNITIPPGATILNAYIEFETDEISQPVTSVTLKHIR